MCRLRSTGNLTRTTSFGGYLANTFDVLLSRSAPLIPGSGNGGGGEMDKNGGSWGENQACEGEGESSHSGKAPVAAADASGEEATGDDLPETAHLGAVPDRPKRLSGDVAGHQVQARRDGPVGQNPATLPRGLAILGKGMGQIQVIGFQEVQGQVRQKEQLEPVFGQVLGLLKLVAQKRQIGGSDFALIVFALGDGRGD